MRTKNPRWEHVLCATVDANKIGFFGLHPSRTSGREKRAFGYCIIFE
jgi:hypothetical protein